MDAYVWITYHMSNSRHDDEIAESGFRLRVTGENLSRINNGDIPVEIDELCQNFAVLQGYDRGLFVSAEFRGEAL